MSILFFPITPFSFFSWELGAETDLERLLLCLVLLCTAFGFPESSGGCKAVTPDKTGPARHSTYWLREKYISIKTNHSGEVWD
jgi:hypothetical protein